MHGLFHAAGLALLRRFVSPSCMLSGNASWDMSTTPAPMPCPVPEGWEVDWSIINSTAGMWTQPSAFDPVNRTWGWITLDWQSNREAWLVKDPNKASCEASMAANCAALKKAGKVSQESYLFLWGACFYLCWTLRYIALGRNSPNAVYFC